MQTHVVAKTLLFNTAGELLVLTRSHTDPHRPGGFDLPGGKIELGETIEAGAVREACEEAGLQLAAQDLRPVYSLTTTDVSKGVNRLHVYFMAAAPATPVKLSYEHSEYAWRKLRDAAQQADTARYQALCNYILDNKLEADLWRPAK